jgi:hypothetical protein
MALGDKLFIADKPTLDNCFDIKAYTPIYKRTQITPTTANEFQTVLDVTGGGYLTEVTAYTAEAAVLGVLRITLDGVVTYMGKFAVTAMTGFRQEPGWSRSGNTYEQTQPNASASGGQFLYNVTYPSINDTLTTFFLLSQPLFFSTSCKIEIKYANNTYNVVQYAYVGGVR